MENSFFPEFGEGIFNSFFGTKKSGKVANVKKVDYTYDSTLADFQALYRRHRSLLAATRAFCAAP